MGTESAPSSLHRVPRLRLYEQIVQQLLAHIEQTGLQPGDRLPAERELAVALGVSRASLAQALVALEVLGTISVRHGEGAIILERPDEGKLITALRNHQDRLPEIIEARSALEVKLARLAADRRTDDDLARIDAALTRMEEDIRGGGRGVGGDEAFHAAVTAAGHSALLARLMQEISALILDTRLESLAQPGRPGASLEGHRRIADAIRAGRPDDAARAMQDHITMVSDVALLREDT